MPYSDLQVGPKHESGTGLRPVPLGVSGSTRYGQPSGNGLQAHGSHGPRPPKNTWSIINERSTESENASQLKSPRLVGQLGSFGSGPPKKTASINSDKSTESAKPSAFMSA